MKDGIITHELNDPPKITRARIIVIVIFALGSILTILGTYFEKRYKTAPKAAESTLSTSSSTTEPLPR